jgi:hypothetical protein
MLHVSRVLGRVGNLVQRIRIALGYVPNVEWFRVQLSRAVALDRARAHLAIAELERCLAQRRSGIQAGCFARARQ